MNQTRRQFFKTVAATAAGAVAVGVAPRVVRGESDRSVVWGEASQNSSFCWVQVPLRDQGYGDSYFYAEVKWHETREKIKKGQALVWNPDGTVRGA